MGKIGKKLCETAGETLLEMVLSIALFAMLMGMTAMMFGTANRSTARNIQTDAAFDDTISGIVKDEGASLAELQTITFSVDGNAVSVDVKRMEYGALSKFTIDE